MEWGSGGSPPQGMPFRGFSDDDDKIIVGARRDRKRKVDDNVVNRQGMFTEKLAAVVGPSYVLGSYS